GRRRPVSDPQAVSRSKPMKAVGMRLLPIASAPSSLLAGLILRDAAVAARLALRAGLAAGLGVGSPAHRCSGANGRHSEKRQRAQQCLHRIPPESMRTLECRHTVNTQVRPTPLKGAT